MTIEIPQERWKSFCARLNTHDDALMDIRIQFGGEIRLLAQNVPLRSVIFDETSDACSNSITIEFGQLGQRILQHRVIEPNRLILRKESTSEHYHLLEMPAESGTTVVIFRPGISVSLLNEAGVPA